MKIYPNILWHGPSSGPLCRKTFWGFVNDGLFQTPAPPCHPWGREDATGLQGYLNAPGRNSFYLRDKGATFLGH